MHKSCSREQLETLTMAVKSLEQPTQERSWESQELLPRQLETLSVAVKPLESISSGA